MTSPVGGDHDGEVRRDVPVRRVGAAEGRVGVGAERAADDQHGDDREARGRRSGRAGRAAVSATSARTRRAAASGASRPRSRAGLDSVAVVIARLRQRSVGGLGRCVGVSSSRCSRAASRSGSSTSQVGGHGPRRTRSAPTCAIDLPVAARPRRRPPTHVTVARRRAAGAARRATVGAVGRSQLNRTVRPAGVPVDELGRRALVEHPAAAHRDHPVAQHLGLVELVGDEQDRGALVAQLRHGRPHVAAGGRVEALRQLVEDHQPRPVEQRQHEEQPLPLAAADSAGERRPAPRAEAELLEQLVAVAGRARWRTARPPRRPAAGRAAPESCSWLPSIGAQPLGVARPGRSRARAGRRRRGGAGPGCTRPWWSCRRRWRRSGRRSRRRARRGRDRRRRRGRRRTCAARRTVTTVSSRAGGVWSLSWDDPSPPGGPGTSTHG